MSTRPPSIKRIRVPTDAESGKVELDLIEPREHAAWMQRVADALAGYDPETITAVAALLSTHKADFANPHQVTLEQLGGEPGGTAAALVSVEASTRAAADTANSTSLNLHVADTTTHGTSGNIVGTSDAQTLSNKTMDASNKFGGMSNYTMFESDGTPVAVGDATTYDDSQAAVIYMRTGGTALTLDVLAGGLYQYRLDKTDEVQSQIQLSHRYKVDSNIHFHVHLINKAAVGATAYNVGIEVEYMWLSIGTAAPATPTVTLATVNCSFQNAAALTHKVFEIATLTPPATAGSISSILFFRLKRVGATTEDLAGNNIFMGGIDVHTEQDTPGSRQEYIK